MSRIWTLLKSKTVYGAFGAAGAYLYQQLQTKGSLNGADWLMAGSAFLAAIGVRDAIAKSAATK